MLNKNNFIILAGIILILVALIFPFTIMGSGTISSFIILSLLGLVCCGGLGTTLLFTGIHLNKKSKEL